MKLHLPKSLRAALLACLAAVAPIATTVATSSMIAGTLSYTMLAPQAEASIYIWDGDTNSNFHDANNWSNSGATDTGTWWKAAWGAEAGGGWTVPNMIQFSGTDATNKTLNVSFSSFDISGVIVDTGATGYVLASSTTSGRVLNLRGAQDSDASAAITAGEVNFIINENFDIGTSATSTNTYFTTCNYMAKVNSTVATDAIFTIYVATYAVGAYETDLSGGGKMVVNAISSYTGTGAWNISGSSTLQLDGNAYGMLSTSSSVNLSGGSVVTSSGTTVTSTIVVSGSGNSLSTTTDGGSLTLNGSISYTDSLDADFASSLDLGNSIVTFGSDLVFAFDGVSAAGEYTILTGLSAETVLSSIITSGIDGYYVSDWSITDEGNLVMTLAAAAGLTWSGDADTTWSGENWADAAGESSTYVTDSEVTFSNTDALTVTVDMDVATTTLSFDGSGNTTLTTSDDGTYAITNATSLSVSAGTVDIAVDISTATIDVTGGSLTFSDDLTCAGAISVGTAASLSLAENASVTASLGTITIAADATGMSSDIAFTAANLAVNGGTNSFAEAVTITGNASLSGGTNTFEGATGITGTLSVGNSSTSATFDAAVTAGAATFTNGTTTFNDALTVDGTATLSGGTVYLNGTTNAAALALSNSSTLNYGENGSLTVSGAFTTTGGTVNGAFSAASVTASSGTTTFNGTVTSAGNLSTGTGTVYFNAADNSFSSFSMSGNGGTISLASDASLEFTTSSGSAYGNNVSWTLGSESSVTFNSLVSTYGGSTWTINGDTSNAAGGTIYFDAGIAIGSANGSTRTGNMTVGQYASVEVANTLSFGNTTYGGNLTVNGNFTSNAAITVDGTGTSSITVNSTGVLTLAEGLTVTQTTDSTGTLNLGVTGTLVLGNQDDTSTDYSSIITTTMNSGSTLKAGDEVTNVASTLTYVEGSSITLDGNGNSLVMQSNIDASTLALNISGAVTLAGSTNVSSITVATAANLSISGEYAFTGDNTITNNGTVTLLSGVSLDISALMTATEAGSYSITLIDCIDDATVDYGELSLASIFGADTMVGLTDVSFVDGVFTYTIGGEFITWSGGGELSLGTDQTINGIVYSDNVPVILDTENVTVKLTSDVATSSLTITGGITVTLSSEGGYELNSSDVLIGTGSTLAAAVALLGADVSFANSASDSTLSLDLGDATLSNYAGIDGYTGELSISNGTYYVSSNEAYLDFTTLTVNAGAQFELYYSSLNKSYDIDLFLKGGDSAETAASLVANWGTISADITLSGYTNISDNGQDIFLTGDISNSSADDVLTVGGSATVYVSGDFDFTGSLNLNAGTLALSAASTVGSVTATGASTLGVTTSLTVGETLTLTGTQNLSLSEGSSITGTSINNVDLSSMTVSSSAESLTISGTVGMSSLSILGTNIYLTADAQVTVGGGASTGSGTQISNASDTELNINLAAGSLLSQNISLWTNTTAAQTINVTGGGTYEITGILTRNGGNQGTATINVGSVLDSATTMHITGTSTTSTTSGLVTNGGTGGVTDINVYGTLILDAGIYSFQAVDTTIDVYSGGTLTLNRGTYMYDDVSSVFITVQSGATLELGNTIDDSGEVVNVNGATITLANGATLTGNGATFDATETSFTTSTTTTSAFDFTLADNATVNLKSESDNSLVLTGTLSSETAGVTITGGGTVQLAGTTSLATVTVAADSTLSISGTYSFNSAITGEGAVSILEGASLDITGLTLATTEGETSTTYSYTLVEGATLSLADETSISTYLNDASMALISDYDWSYADGVISYVIAELAQTVYTIDGITDYVDADGTSKSDLYVLFSVATADDKVIMNMVDTDAGASSKFWPAEEDLSSDYTCDAGEIEIVSWYINDGSTTKSWTFNSTITGEGDITFVAWSSTPGATNDNLFTFKGDMSAWTGDIIAVENSSGAYGLSVAITGTDSSAASGTGSITIEGPAEYLEYSFTGETTIANKAITVSNLNLKGGGDYSVTNGVTVSGTTSIAADTDVSLGGTSSIADLSMGSNSSLEVLDGATLSLSGAYSFSDDTSIVNKGTITLLDGVEFDITGVTFAENSDGDYYAVLISGDGTIDLGELELTDIFTSASLAGLSSYSFVNGVFTYSELSGWEYTGGAETLDLSTSTVVNGDTYTNEAGLTFSTANASVNLTESLSPDFITIKGGITVDISSEGGYTLSSSTIKIGSGSTLSLDYEVIGSTMDFSASASDSTLTLVIGEGDTYTDVVNSDEDVNVTNLQTYTGNLVVTGGGSLVTDASWMSNTVYPYNFASVTLEGTSSMTLARYTMGDVSFANSSAESTISMWANCTAFISTYDTVLSGYKGNVIITNGQYSFSSAVDYVFSSLTVTATGTTEYGQFVITSGTNDAIISDADTDCTITLNGCTDQTAYFTVNGGATIYADFVTVTSGTMNIASSVSLYGDITDSSADDTTYKTGAGALVVNGSIDVDGTFTVSAGTVAVGDMTLSAGSVTGTLSSNSITDATLSSVTMEATSDVTLSGTVSLVATTVTGSSMIVGTDSTLSLDADSSVASITLSGGTVSTAGTLSSALVITTAGGSLTSTTDDALVLDCAISYSGDITSISLSGMTVSLGDSFSIDLGNSITSDGMVIFTDVVASVDLLDSLNALSDSYEWSITDGSISVVSTGVVVDDPYWNPSTGEFTGGSGDYASTDFTINTDDATTALLNTGDGVSIDDLSIYGENSLTIEGTGALVAGEITIASDVTATVAVEADSVTVTGADVSFNAGLSTDALTLSGTSSAALYGTIGDVSFTSSDSLTFTGDTTVTSISRTAGDTITLNDGDTETASTLTIGGGATAGTVEGDADMTKLSGNYSVSVSVGDTISDNFKLAITAGTLSVSGGGTYEITQLVMSASSSTTSYLTIEAGSTLNIVGTNSTTSGAYYYAACLGNWGATNVISVDGTLEIADSLYVKDGYAEITVGGTGTLSLAKGLDASQYSSGKTITMDISGTLLLGDSSAASDATITSVTMQDGSTIQSNGLSTSGTTTVYNAISFADDATVTLASGDSDTLVMSGDITGASATASISGSVELAGGGSLANVSVGAGSALTLSGTLTGGVTLSGASLTVSGTLSNAISVTAANSSLSSSTDSLTLNSTITLSEGISLSLSDIATVSLDSGFSLDLSDWTLATDGTSYTVFTDLGTDLSASEYLTVSDAEYDLVWTYDEENDTLSFTLNGVTANASWDSTTGTITGGDTEDYSATAISISTTGVDSAALHTGEGLALGSLDVSGSNDLTIDGTSLTVNGAVTIANTVVLETQLTAESLVLNSGTLSVDYSSDETSLAVTGTGSLAVASGSDLNLADGTTGTFTLSGAGDVSYDGTAETTITASTYTGALTVEEGSSGLTVNAGAIVENTEDADRFALTLNDDITVKNTNTSSSGTQYLYLSSLSGTGDINAAGVSNYRHINIDLSMSNDNAWDGAIAFTNSYTAGSLTVGSTGETAYTLTLSQGMSSTADNLSFSTLTIGNANVKLVGNAEWTSNVSFSDADATLILAGNDIVVGTNITAFTSSETGYGTVEVAMADDKTTTISAANSSYSGEFIVTSGTLSVTNVDALGTVGTVTVNGGTLSLGVADLTASDITLNGGTILAATGTLTEDITVTATSSLAGADSALVLNSAITLDQGTSLDLSSAGTVSLGDSFSLVLDYSLVDGQYTIFTNAANDFSSLLASSDVTYGEDASSDYVFTWSYDDNNDIILTVATVIPTQELVWAGGDNGTWSDGGTGWSDDESFANGYTVTFDATYAGSTVTVDADGVSVLNMTVDADYGFEGGAITVTKALSIAADASVDMDSVVNLEGATLTLGEGASLSLDGNTSVTIGSLDNAGTITTAADVTLTTATATGGTLTAGAVTLTGGDTFTSLTATGTVTAAGDLTATDLSMASGSSITGAVTSEGSVTITGVADTSVGSLSAGSLTTGTGELTITGTTFYTSTDLNNGGTITATDAMAMIMGTVTDGGNFSSASLYLYTSASFDELDVTGMVSASGSLTVGDGSSIGSLTAGYDSTADAYVGASLSTSDIVSIGSVDSYGLSSLTNTGSLDIDSSVTVYGSFSNTGSLDVDGSLTLSTATTAGGTVTAGAVTLTGDNTFTSITASGAVTAAGSLSVGTLSMGAGSDVGTLTGVSSLTTSGTVSVDSVATVGSLMNSGTLNVDSDVSVTGTFTNMGTFTTTGDLTLSAGTYSGGVVSVDDLTIGGTTGMSIFSGITATGTVTVDHSLYLTDSTQSNSIGAWAGDGGVMLYEGVSLTISSNATFVGMFYNGGTIDMGSNALTVNSETAAGGTVTAGDVALTGDNTFTSITASGAVTATGSLSVGTLSMGDGSSVGTLTDVSSLTTSGTVLVGSLTTVDTLSNTGTLGISSDLTVNSSVTNGGALTANFVTINGDANFTSLAAYDGARITGDANLGKLTSYDDVTVTGSLTVGEGTSVTGTVDAASLTTSGAVTVNALNTSSLSNAGVLTVLNNTTITLSSLDNTGTISAKAASMNLTGTVTNGGTLEAANVALYTDASFTKLTVTGTVSTANSLSLGDDSYIESLTGVSNVGASLTTTGSVYIDSVDDSGLSSLSNSGELTINSDVAITGEFTNMGTVTVDGDLTLESSTSTGGTVSSGGLTLVGGDTFTSIITHWGLTTGGTLTTGSLSVGSSTMSLGGALSVTGDLAVSNSLTSLDVAVNYDLDGSAIITAASIDSSITSIDLSFSDDLASLTSLGYKDGATYSLFDLDTAYTGDLTIDGLSADDFSTELSNGAIVTLKTDDAGNYVLLYTLESIIMGEGEGDIWDGTTTTDGEVVELAGSLTVDGNQTAAEIQVAGGTTVVLSVNEDADSAKLNIDGNIGVSGDSTELTLAVDSVTSDSVSITDSSSLIVGDETILATGSMSVGADASFSNEGESSITALTSVEGASIENSGKLNLSAGTDADAIANTGTLNLTDSAKVGTVENSGALTVTDATVATIDNSGSATTTLAGTTEVDFITGSGTTTLDSGTISITNMSTSATLAVADGATVDYSGDTTLISLSLGSDSTMSIVDETAVTNLSLAEGSTLDVTGDTAVTSLGGAGTISVDGDLNLTYVSGSSTSVEATGTVTMDDTAELVSVTSDTLITGSAAIDSLTVNNIVLTNMTYQKSSMSNGISMLSLTFDASPDYVLDLGELKDYNSNGTINLSLRALDEDTTAGTYYLVNGATWSDFTLDTYTSEMINILVNDYNMDVVKTTSTGEDTVLVIAEASNRTWSTSTNYVLSDLCDSEELACIKPIYNEDGTLASVDVLDTVEQVNVDASLAINLEGLNDEVVLCDLKGVEGATLTITGDADEDASIMLYNDSTTYANNALIADNLNMCVASAETGELNLAKLDLTNGSFMVVLDSADFTVGTLGVESDSIMIVQGGADFTVGTLSLESNSIIVAESGAEVTVGTLSLDSISTMVAGDDANFTVGSLTAEAGSVIYGLITLSAGESTLAGNYDGASITLTNGATATLASDSTDLAVYGNSGTLNLSSAYSVGTVALTGADITVNSVDNASVVLSDSLSMEGGTLTISLSTESIGDASYTVFSGDVSLTDTSILISQSDSVTSLDLANNTSYDLFTLTDGELDLSGVSFELEGDVFGKYMSNVTIDAETGVVSATYFVAADFYTKMAQTENGAAGLSLVSSAFMASATSTGDLADVVDSLDAYSAEGNYAAADKLGAAVAGATTTSIGSAMMSDVERQLRTVRNRTKSMGLGDCVTSEKAAGVSAWISAEAGNSQLSSDGTRAGHSFNNYGGSVGVEYKVSDAASFGLSYTSMYGNLSSSGADTAEGHLDTMYTSVYANVKTGNWNHSFVASFGTADAELDRTVSTSSSSYKTQGDTDGTAFGLMYEVTGCYAMNEDKSTVLQPIFNVSLINSSIDGYTEKNSNAALIVGEQDNTYATFGLGAGLESIVGEGAFNRSSVLSARALLKVDAGHRTSEADVSLVNNAGVTETVKGAEVGAVGVELGVGLTIPVTEETGALFMDFSCEFRSGMTNVNGSVGYRFSF